MDGLNYLDYYLEIVQLKLFLFVVFVFVKIINHVCWYTQLINNIF